MIRKCFSFGRNACTYFFFFVFISLVSQRFCLQVQRREHFRLSKAAQFVDRRLLQDLNRARRLVESLDESAGRKR